MVSSFNLISDSIQHIAMRFKQLLAIARCINSFLYVIFLLATNISINCLSEVVEQCTQTIILLDRLHNLFHNDETKLINHFSHELFFPSLFEI